MSNVCKIASLCQTNTITSCPSHTDNEALSTSLSSQLTAEGTNKVMLLFPSRPLSKRLILLWQSYKSWPVRRLHTKTTHPTTACSAWQRGGQCSFSAVGVHAVRKKNTHKLKHRHLTYWAIHTWKTKHWIQKQQDDQTWQSQNKESKRYSQHGSSQFPEVLFEKHCVADQKQQLFWLQLRFYFGSWLLRGPGPSLL